MLSSLGCCRAINVVLQFTCHAPVLPYPVTRELGACTPAGLGICNKVGCRTLLLFSVLCVAAPVLMVFVAVLREA